jgi:hypothetical protein
LRPRRRRSGRAPTQQTSSRRDKALPPIAGCLCRLAVSTQPPVARAGRSRPHHLCSSLAQISSPPRTTVMCRPMNVQAARRVARPPAFSAPWRPRAYAGAARPDPCPTALPSSDPRQPGSQGRRPSVSSPAPLHPRATAMLACSTLAPPPVTLAGFKRALPQLYRRKGRGVCLSPRALCSPRGRRGQGVGRATPGGGGRGRRKGRQKSRRRRKEEVDC